MDTIIKSPATSFSPAAGVVSIGYDNIYVNGEDMLSADRAAIEQTHATTNYNGDFAVRRTARWIFRATSQPRGKPDDHSRRRTGDKLYGNYYRSDLSFVDAARDEVIDWLDKSSDARS